MPEGFAAGVHVGEEDGEVEVDGVIVTVVVVVVVLADGVM